MFLRVLEIFFQELDPLKVKFVSVGVSFGESASRESL